MEGERRKRKLEDEEENDEKKMEEFFALIKSTKDARDLLFTKEKTDKEVEEKKAKGIWNPTFQPEDFIGHGEFGKNNISAPLAGPSGKEKEKEKEIIEKDYLAAVAPAAENEEKEKEKEKANDHLDLNLSL